MTTNHFLTGLLLLLFGNIILAQSNNDWIVENGYDKTYYKFPVNEAGLHRINYEVLEAANVDLSNATNFRLYAKGEQVPIWISNEQDFGAGDFIEFVAKTNDGSLDRQLYVLDNWQNNPDLSLFNDTLHYYLSWNDQGGNLRYQQTANELATPPAPEPYFMHQSRINHAVEFNPGTPFRFAGTNQTYSAFDRCEGWMSSVISPDSGTFDVAVPTPAAFVGPGAPPALLETKLIGLSNEFAYYPDHHAQVDVSGSTIIDETYEGFDCQTAFANFSQDLLNADVANETVVSYLAVGDLYPEGKDDYAVPFTAITYARAFDLQGGSSISFRLPTDGDKYVEFENFAGLQAVLYDETNARRYTPFVEAGSCKFFLQDNPQSINGMNLYLSAIDENQAITKIEQLEPRQWTDYTESPEASFLMLYAAALDEEVDGQHPVQDYAAYRSGAAGGSHSVQAIEIEELYDQYAWGTRGHPIAIQDFVKAMLQSSGPPQHLLLLGKSIEYQECRFEVDNSVRNLIPTYGFPGSDVLLSSAAPLGIVPRLSTGRVSAANANELLTYLNKLRAYESTCLAGGTDWQRDALHLSVASNADFDGNGVSDDEETQLAALEVLGAMIGQQPFNGEVLQTYSEVNASLSGGVAAQNLTAAQYGEFEQHIADGVGIINAVGTYYQGDIFNPWDWSDSWPFEAPVVEQGRYPIVLSSGNFAGKFHKAEANARLDDWLLSPERGAIAGLAHGGLLFPTFNVLLAESLHQHFTANDYGSSLGSCFRNSLQDLYVGPTDSTTIYYQGIRRMIEGAHWAGDPAIRFAFSESADYFFPDGESSVSILPETVNEDTEQITLTVEVQLAGQPGQLPLGINVVAINEQADFESLLISSIEISLPDPIASYTYNIDISALPAGPTQLLVSLNALGSLSESCYANNEQILEITVPGDVEPNAIRLPLVTDQLIHPNPGTGSFFVTLDSDERYFFSVFDVNGKKVQHQVERSGKNRSIELIDARPGVYHLEAVGEKSGKSLVSRVMVL